MIHFNFPPPCFGTLSNSFLHQDKYSKLLLFDIFFAHMNEWLLKQASFNVFLTGYTQGFHNTPVTVEIVAHSVEDNCTQPLILSFDNIPGPVSWDGGVDSSFSSTPYLDTLRFL